MKKTYVVVMGIKLHRNDNIYGKGKGGWLFYCPGCGGSHAPADTWSFNGDLEKPTFSPSILVKWFKCDNPDDLFGTDGKVKIGQDGRVAGKDIVCHSFITDGKINFLSDCTHHLAGKIVDLPDWDEGLVECT